VLEANGIYDDLSVEDNLDFYAQIYRVTDPKKRIAELLDFVQLDSRPTDKARTLSKGMRQKLAIARALLSDPQVLILDEPTSGLDPRFQKEILLMTANLARSGKTVLLSSHNLREVQEACTIVAFVAHGAIRVAEPVRALLARYGSAKKLFRFENTEEQIKAELLLRSDNKARFVPTAQGLQVLVETKEAEDQILAYLLAHGIKLQQVERMPVDLNDIFDLVV
jgi:ABC-2 type transport system ATP-binding protein